MKVNAMPSPAKLSTKVIPSPEKLEQFSLGQRSQLLKEALMEAGKREELLSLGQRLKQVLWDHHLGQMKGLIQGLKMGLNEWVTPFSGLYRSTPHEIFRDIELADEKGIRWLVQFFQSRWKQRGEMSGETTVTAGLWFLEAYLFIKKLPEGLLGAMRKF
jgi:hypothetical protein